jgi:hypothetical protein
MKVDKKEGGCQGYWTDTDYGRDFDCGYDIDFFCEDCIFGPHPNDKNNKDPRTYKVEEPNP